METNGNSANEMAESQKNVYVRENSVNDMKDHLSDKCFHGNIKGDDCTKSKTEFLDIKMNPVKIQIDYGRQNSVTNPLMNEDDRMWSEVKSKTTDNESDIKIVENEPLLDQFRRLKKCIYCMSVGSLFMLTLAVLVFIILILKTAPQTNTLEEAIEFADAQVAVSAQRQHVKTSGNFMIDQKRLQATGEIRWLQDVYSMFEALSDNSCVKITLSGDYFFNSRFTFKVPIEEERALFTHNLRVISMDDSQDDIFHRQYVNIPSNRDIEYRQTSVFTKIFHHLHAGELICASVSAPELLYVSTIDNDLTIVRLHDDITEVGNH